MTGGDPNTVEATFVFTDVAGFTALTRRGDYLADSHVDARGAAPVMRRDLLRHVLRVFLDPAEQR
jgi:hypothetical protein